MSNPVLDQKEYHIYSVKSISVDTIAEFIFETAQKYKYGYSQNSLTSGDGVFIYVDKEEIFDDDFDEESKFLFEKKWGEMPKTFLSVQCSSGSGVSYLAVHFVQTLQNFYPQTCFYAADKVIFFDSELQDMDPIPD